MLSYYGYTISPNQIETGEGFLICRNVPIARIGDQEYLGREIGLDSDRVVKVHRSSEEVFSDAALASFEGKPVTDDHPPELLDPDNVSLYLKGHAEQIRRGTGDWEGYVVADLHIQDRTLIDAVQNGKREISCGYECEYVDNGDGTYSQKNIRGNHIAVVNRGRAGKRAAILDSDTAKKEQSRRTERKKMKKNGWLLNLFGQAVKDKSPEEIEQMAQDAAEALDGENPAQEETGKEGSGKKEPGEPPKEPGKEKEGTTDGVDIGAIVQAVLAAMKPADAPKSSIDAAIEKLYASCEPPAADGKGTEPRVVPAEGMDEAAPVVDKAVAAAILKAVRPAVAAIEDEKQRNAVADAIIASVTASDGSSDITKIMQAAQKNALQKQGVSPQTDMDAVQKFYDNMNPHRKESK